ncbi:MAG: alkaline phosphatase family protein [Shewanella sp.]|nr:alkaline phosphatase family protein [Shewanella sp.]
MKIALASCCKIQKRPVQPAWKAIEEKQPDLLLLLGDNVYGGTFTFSWKKYHKQLENRYKRQLSEANFKKLTEKVPFKAIWDDHDFAKGDNGKGALIAEKYKSKSRDLFHKYMNSSTNYPMAYYSFVHENAKFIMLDVRYYREEPSRNASILGRDQEEWLKEELNHDKKFTIICSGTTLTSGKGERWKNYKNYYREFLDLLKPINNVIFLSGDIHKNRFVDHGGFYEVVSSGVARKNKDNYGIIDLQKDYVNIELHGNRETDNSKITIDVSSWKVTEKTNHTGK